MSYPVAAGFPQQAGVMIPEIWAGKLLVKFYDATVLAAISNTDYEGLIKSQGDTVHIRTTPTLTIRSHTKGQALQYETPQPTTVDLVVDKGKYWAFTTDDVDMAQADYNYVDDWTTDASEQLKISIDTDILADIYADAHADNKGTTAGHISNDINLGTTGSPIALTKANILDYIVDMNTVLTEQNVPESGRFIVVPPWVSGMIMKSDLKDASLSGDGTSILRNGRLGMIGKFTIYESNLLATTSDSGHTVTNMIFGHKTALTFASQLLKNEGPIRSETSFGDKYRGLQVFGYKVVKPESLGHFYAYKSS
jgi:hypothetical protein